MNKEYRQICWKMGLFWKGLSKGRYLVDKVLSGKKASYKDTVAMFCATVAKGKVSNTAPELWWKSVKFLVKNIHPQTSYLIDKLLWNLSQLGEEEFYVKYKQIKKTLKLLYDNGTLMRY